MNIKTGDMCSVSINGLLSRHYGICVGHDRRGQPVFIHNTYRRGFVERASIEEFSLGRTIRIDKRARRGTEWIVVERAESRLGDEYDFVNFNCEHLATYAATGEASSGQIAFLGFGAVAAIVVGIIALFSGGGGSGRA